MVVVSLEELGLALEGEFGAEGGTRTHTGLHPLRPERSASANSATSARNASRWEARSKSVHRILPTPPPTVKRASQWVDRQAGLTHFSFFFPFGGADILVCGGFSKFKRVVRERTSALVRGILRSSAFSGLLRMTSGRESG